MIFVSEIIYDLEDPINFSVFPGHQGGPHNHTITALAVALKQAKSPEFIQYQQQVLTNAKAMEAKFRDLGYSLVSNGTDTHLLLLDLRNQTIDGARVERILELVNIASNKNTVPGDKSALIPGGLRVGTPAMTTRGLGPKDFETVCDFIHEAIQLTKTVNSQSDGPKFKQFKSTVGANGGPVKVQVAELKAKVIEFAKSFPVVGWDVNEAE